MRNEICEQPTGEWLSKGEACSPNDKRERQLEKLLKHLLKDYKRLKLLKNVQLARRTPKSQFEKEQCQTNTLHTKVT